jgi:hypothetical protein
MMYSSDGTRFGSFCDEFSLETFSKDLENQPLRDALASYLPLALEH